MGKIKITNLDNQVKNGSKEQVIFATGSLVEELSSEQSSLVIGGHGTSGWTGIVAAPQYGEVAAGQKIYSAKYPLIV